MTTAVPSTALATIQPAFTDAERLALAGFLAGYRGLIREAYGMDLRQFTTWCRARSLALFAARRADIESFARELEARGRARATVTRRLCTIAGFYKYAVEEELLDHSPAAHVRRPRVDYESPASRESTKKYAVPGGARTPGARAGTGTYRAHVPGPRTTARNPGPTTSRGQRPGYRGAGHGGGYTRGYVHRGRSPRRPASVSCPRRVRYAGSCTCPPPGNGGYARPVVTIGAVVADDGAADLIARGRQLREDARVPLGIMAGQVGCPWVLLRAWETRAPDLGRLSYRDAAAVARWVAILGQLDLEQPSSLG